MIDFDEMVRARQKLMELDDRIVSMSGLYDEE